MNIFNLDTFTDNNSNSAPLISNMEQYEKSYTVMNVFRNGMNSFQNGMNMFRTGMKTFQIGTGTQKNQNYQKI